MLTEREDQFYVGGKWRQPVDVTRLPVVNPASEEVVGHIAAGGAHEVDLAVAAARRAFSIFSQATVPDRLGLLRRMHSLLKERAETFAQALVMEMGAAVSFARASQVPFAAEHIRVQMEILEKYQFTTVDGCTATAKEAIGVCALITPWNWPLYQITAKVAPAIAAGCTIVLKPSELSPYSALLFAQLMHDAGTPPGVFNLVNGTGESVGAALASHPDVDMISITGSTRAGVLVAQGRTDCEASGSGTRRQVTEYFARRCRFQRGGSEGRACRYAQCRPVVQRPDAHARARTSARRSGGTGKRHCACHPRRCAA